MIYCVDTSSLLAGWNERYPLANVPGFWRKFDELLEQKRVVAPVEVRNEIKRKEDGLADYLKNRTALFVELEVEIQLAARDILKEFPLADQGPGQ
jgi:hypothetical protein